MAYIKKITRWFLLAILFYLITFTFNLKTGYLDNISKNIGLNIAGIILYPGEITLKKIQDLWDSYIYLVDVEKENKKLKEQINSLKITVARLKIKEKEWERIVKLLNFSPLFKWKLIGARIIYEKIGPASVLKSFVIECGEANGVEKNSPVITPDGLVGLVLKTSPFFSQVLLITDENSKVPVISRTNRTRGILEGTGTNNLLELKYISNTAVLNEGEEIVTSGLGGIFPKGIPVGRVVKIENDKSSFFKKVLVNPFVDIDKLEEVLVLLPSKKDKMFFPRH